MKTQNFVLLTFSIVTLGILTIAKATVAESCAIAQSIYRDVNGKGFQLMFSLPPAGSAIHARATLYHPQQGQLYQFNVTQTSGYGSIWLSEVANRAERDRGLWITFFDQNLQSATPTILGEETQAPQYAMISELGSFDYYKRRGKQNNEVLLQDTLWIHDRCQ